MIVGVKFRFAFRPDMWQTLFEVPQSSSIQHLANFAVSLRIIQKDCSGCFVYYRACDFQHC